MKLVVVESPNKTAKIREFLGPQYRVAASFGHVADLPVSGDLAVGFRDGHVLPRYEMLERAGRAIADLKRDMESPLPRTLISNVRALPSSSP